MSRCDGWVNLVVNAVKDDSSSTCESIFNFPSQTKNNNLILWIRSFKTLVEISLKNPSSWSAVSDVWNMESQQNPEITMMLYGPPKYYFATSLPPY